MGVAASNSALHSYSVFPFYVRQKTVDKYVCGLYHFIRPASSIPFQPNYGDPPVSEQDCEDFSCIGQSDFLCSEVGKEAEETAVRIFLGPI